MRADIFVAPDLEDPEVEVLRRIESLRDQIQQATGGFGRPRKWLGTLRSLVQAKAIQGSNSIEGYRVSIEDAMAAVQGEEVLEASEESRLALEGYQSAMTYILRLADDRFFEYSNQLFKSLHFMMMQHRPDKNPGTWRPGSIHVENQDTGEVVYQGPDVELVPGLMDRLVESVSKIDSGDATVGAAMAHLNFVMIHPFSDGNGRMARCLQTLVLARCGQIYPAFLSIEEYLGRYFRDYYDVLALVGNGTWSPERDARPWVRFCLTAHFRQATTMVRRIDEMTRLWEYLEELGADHGLPERTLIALSDAAMGYRVRNSTYRKRADIKEQLATRDLRLLLDLGLLDAHGEKRGRFYRGSSALLSFFGKLRSSRKPIGDPFSRP